MEKKYVMNRIIDYCTERARQAYWLGKRNPEKHNECMMLAYTIFQDILKAGRERLAVRIEFEQFVWGIGVKCAANDDYGGIHKAVADKLSKSLHFELFVLPDIGEYIEETCPSCNGVARIYWNIKEDGYKAYCPICGGRLMLCSECMTAEDERGCDYNLKTDTCWRREG